MSNHHSTKELAHMQWFTILTKLGVDSSLLDGKHHPSPISGGKDGFRFIDKGGDGHYVDKGTFGDGFELLHLLYGWDFKTATKNIDEAMGWGEGEYTPPTQAEREAIKAEHAKKAEACAKALQAQRDEVAAACVERWNKATPVQDDNHAYLKAKGVESQGLRIDSKGFLLVPIYQSKGKLTSLQTIDSKGKKRFPTAAETGGGYFPIHGKGNDVVVVEGYATGASIYAATGKTVIVAFNDGNLLKVAKKFRDLMPQAKIIIGADNDQKQDKNAGLDAALKAAQAVGGVIALPSGKQGFSTDWNDIHAASGLDDVMGGILTAKPPQDLMRILGIAPSCDEKALSGDSIDMDEWGEPEPLVNTLLPVPAFDIELLPRGFQDYVRDSAYTMQAPYEFTAVSLMCSLGAVLGNRCCIYPKAVADWKVYPNLWGALVGRPSTKKSPTLGDGTKGIYNLNKASIEAVKKANEHAGMRSKIFKKQETVFTNTYADELAECGFDSERGKEIMKLAPQKPEPARYRKYVLNAVTPEKLAMIMADNDNGILVLRDELISWIRALENDTGQDARGFMIEAWNACNTHEYATVAHGTIYIEKCCASVLGGIQPPLLANMVRDTIEQNNGDDGLLQRFQMMVYPDPLPNWDYIDKAANKTAYKKMCQIFTQAAGQSGKARFTDEAQAVFVEWYSKNERSIKHEPLPCLESLIGKYGKLMASIALILHVAERAIDAPDQMLTKVDKESALKAVRWCELLKAHARRIYGMGDVTDITNARRVVEMVIEGKLPHLFTLGDLQRKNLSGLKGKQSGKVLELLEQKGWLKLTKKTNPKGKPAVFYTLHPEAEKNLQSPKAPLTKFTIMEKKDNSDNSEGVSSTQDEKTTSEKAPKKAHIFDGCEDVIDGCFSIEA